MSVSIGSGISYFRGEGTDNNSVFYNNGLPIPYTQVTSSKSFGRKAHTNYLAGLQADFRLHPKWVLSFSTHFESSGGRMDGDSLVSPSSSYKINGEYRRYYHYISLNPQIARVVFQKKTTLLIHSGIDYTSKLDRGVNFTYKDQSNTPWSVGGSGDEPEVNDCRITAGLTVNFKKWGLDLNYKHGIVNYNNNSEQEVYSRLLHLRLLYRLFRLR